MPTFRNINSVQKQAESAWKASVQRPNQLSTQQAPLRCSVLGDVTDRCADM